MGQSLLDAFGLLANTAGGDREGSPRVSNLIQEVIVDQRTTKTKRGNMKYRVHRLEINRDNMQEALEQFLNKLEGDVVAVMPNVRPTFLVYGVKVDFVMVVEKVE